MASNIILLRIVHPLYMYKHRVENKGNDNKMEDHKRDGSIWFFAKDFPINSL